MLHQAYFIMPKHLWQIFKQNVFKPDGLKTSEYSFSSQRKTALKMFRLCTYRCISYFLSGVEFFFSCQSMKKTSTSRPVCKHSRQTGMHSRATAPNHKCKSLFWTQEVALLQLESQKHTQNLAYHIIALYCYTGLCALSVINLTLCFLAVQVYKGTCFVSLPRKVHVGHL